MQLHMIILLLNFLVIFATPLLFSDLCPVKEIYPPTISQKDNKADACANPEKEDKEPREEKKAKEPCEEKKEKEANGEKKEKESNDEKKEKDADEKKKEPAVKHLKLGNLAFPTSQQPTPLISFGQNLLDEGQFDIQEVATKFKGKREYFIDIQNTLIYAFSDDLAILIDYSNAIRFRQNNNRSSGPEDLIIQMEYAPYTKENYTYIDQLTIVGNITIPTGSIKKDPATGKGANTFFIGSTFSRVAIDWFYFTSYGGIFCATSHRTRAGDQFLYQYGVGRRIFNNSNWLLDWMLEFDGQYSAKDKIEGVTDRNSGGNIIYVTPSFFLASKKSLVVQLGIGFPIVQQLYGHQNRKEYLLQTKISWTF